MSFWNLAIVFEAKTHYPIKCSCEVQVKVGVCLFDYKTSGSFSSSPLLGFHLDSGSPRAWEACNAGGKRDSQPLGWN